MTSDRVSLVSSFFRPVLCNASDEDRVPLPVLEPPKTVRHLTLTLPTGRLVMADWFRMEAFNKGMNKLSGETEAGYNINYAFGLDARARDYYEKAGVVIVQVGNSSPRAYADTPGVWRMGHVDEDADVFWNGDTDERSCLACPEPVWSTCTDLWANTFASPEAIVKIMMASGDYADMADAESDLLLYCQKTYGANLVELGTQELHVYAPTGFAETLRPEGVMNSVGHGIIPMEDWREDAYILSTQPLSVSPLALSEEVWTEALMDDGSDVPTPFT